MMYWLICFVLFAAPLSFSMQENHRSGCIDLVHFKELHDYILTCKNPCANESFFSQIPLDIRNLIWPYITYSLCKQMVDDLGACKSKPLYEAILSDSVGKTCTESVDLLLVEDHLPVNGEADQYDTITPLHCAAWINHKPLVERLIAYGAKIDATNQEGYTPLHFAVINGHEDIVNLLLMHGASITQIDRMHGQNALAMANERMHRILVAQMTGTRRYKNTHTAWTTWKNILFCLCIDVPCFIFKHPPCQGV